MRIAIIFLGKIYYNDISKTFTSIYNNNDSRAKKIYIGHERKIRRV